MKAEQSCKEIAKFTQRHSAGGNDQCTLDAKQERVYLAPMERSVTGGLEGKSVPPAEERQA